MTVPFTTQSLQDALTAKLALNFGTEPGEATDQEMLKACALVLRDVMALRGVQTAKETKKEQKKQVHYLSLEFLMGRSLMKNAYNLGVLPELKEALGNLGFKSGDLFELEPDAGLGNGGLSDALLTASLRNNLFLLLAALLCCFPILELPKKWMQKSAGAYVFFSITGTVLAAALFLLSSILLVDATNMPFLYTKF